MNSSSILKKFKRRSNHMSSFYNMWNYDYIQQQAQNNHFKQIKKVQDAAKSLKDFLDNCDQIEPAYQNAASAEFCAILAEYLRKHNG